MRKYYAKLFGSKENLYYLCSVKFTQYIIKYYTNSLYYKPIICQICQWIQTNQKD